MTRRELKERYFDWLCEMIRYNGRNASQSSYRKLLRRLHEIEFTYTIPMDGNREADGIELRYRFGDDNHYFQPMIGSFLDDCPCSMLEMMTALAIRCEQIMSDPELGDRTGRWFWNMISNLGLGGMTDDRYDRFYTDETVKKFLNHEYKRDGTGGLFTVKQSGKDIRSEEIWCQMCWYLNEAESE